MMPFMRMSPYAGLLQRNAKKRGWFRKGFAMGRRVTSKHASVERLPSRTGLGIG
jgi:hypothetical protein